MGFDLSPVRFFFNFEGINQCMLGSKTSRGLVTHNMRRVMKLNKDSVVDAFKVSTKEGGVTVEIKAQRSRWPQESGTNKPGREVLLRAR